MTLPPPCVRLLICGNADRGDDGAAIAAIAPPRPALPPRLLERLEVRRCGHLRLEDLVDVPATEAAVVVDAAVGIPPGHVVILPLTAIAGDPSVPTPRSTHELPIDQVIGLAALCRDGGVPSGSFVGIGGRRFGYGRPLSRSVRLNIDAYKEAIESELRRLAGVPLGPEETPAEVRPA
jgi:hydrogenase maturation protease